MVGNSDDPFGLGAAHLLIVDQAELRHEYKVCYFFVKYIYILELSGRYLATFTQSKEFLSILHDIFTSFPGYQNECNVNSVFTLENSCVKILFKVHLNTHKRRGLKV